METKVSIFFSFPFFLGFFLKKIHNQLLSTSHSATCQAMISETLAAVEKFSKILDSIFSNLSCSENSLDAAQEISEIFSTAAKGFLWMPKNGERY